MICSAQGMHCTTPHRLFQPCDGLCDVENVQAKNKKGDGLEVWCWNQMQRDPVVQVAEGSIEAIEELPELEKISSAQKVDLKVLALIRSPKCPRMQFACTASFLSAM